MEEYDWKGKTILIAEDYDVNFTLLQAILKKTKANVILVKNGEDAVKKVKSNKEIDLVLMDIQMPALDGYEATKQIKAINSKLPVIAQTAFVMPNETEKLIEAGFDDYLFKPIFKKKLLKKISQFLS